MMILASAAEEGITSHQRSHGPADIAAAAHRRQGSLSGDESAALVQQGRGLPIVAPDTQLLLLATPSLKRWFRFSLPDIHRKTERAGDPLNPDPLDLIERDLVAGAVVKLGCARAFVRRHRLGVFERSTGLEIGGDAGRAEHVAAELDPEAGVGRAPAHHAVR